MKARTWPAHVRALEKTVELRANEEDDALEEYIKSQDLRIAGYVRDQARRVFYRARETTRTAIRAHERARVMGVVNSLSPEQARGCATKVI